jgi:hypothetical protein
VNASVSVLPVWDDLRQSSLGFYFELYNRDWVAYAIHPVEDRTTRLGVFGSAEAAIGAIQGWHVAAKDQI